MLEFTRLSSFERKQLDLGQLVEETVALFHQGTTEHPCVNLDLPADTATLVADPILLRHALFNLLTNANHAGHSAPIDVRVLPEDNCWTLAVTDRGPGIDEKQKAQLFTPFFTTRSGGIGLGLSVVQHIMALHEGTVEAENLPEGGARFTLRIPIPMETSNEP